MYIGFLKGQRGTSDERWAPVVLRLWRSGVGSIMESIKVGCLSPI